MGHRCLLKQKKLGNHRCLLKQKKTWERIPLLEEVAEIAQSLSEEDMMVVEALMETWMQENPV